MLISVQQKRNNAGADLTSCLLISEPDGDTVGAAQLQQRIVEFAAVAPKRRVIALDVHPDATYDAYFHLQESVVAAYRRLKVAPRISETISETQEASAKEGGAQ